MRSSPLAGQHLVLQALGGLRPRGTSAVSGGGELDDGRHHEPFRLLEAARCA